jgi:hypothetical protein
MLDPLPWTEEEKDSIIAWWSEQNNNKPISMSTKMFHRLLEGAAERVVADRANEIRVLYPFVRSGDTIIPIVSVRGDETIMPALTGAARTLVGKLPKLKVSTFKGTSNA